MLCANENGKFFFFTPKIHRTLISVWKQDAVKIRIVAMPQGCPNIYLRPVSYFALFITLCTAVVALCTSDWYHFKAKKYKGDVERTLYMGIWNECFDNPDFGDCTLMPSNKIKPTKKPTPSTDKEEEEEGSRGVRRYREDISSGMILAIRILYSMGILMLLGAICYPPFYKQMSSDVIKIEVMAVFTAGGGACVFIAMLMITHEVNSMGNLDLCDCCHVDNNNTCIKNIDIANLPEFGFSFVMGWVALGMCLMTASLIYIASKGNVYIEKVY